MDACLRAARLRHAPKCEEGHTAAVATRDDASPSKHRPDAFGKRHAQDCPGPQSVCRSSPDSKPSNVYSFDCGLSLPLLANTSLRRPRRDPWWVPWSILRAVNRPQDISELTSTATNCSRMYRPLVKCKMPSPSTSPFRGGPRHVLSCLVRDFWWCASPLPKGLRSSRESPPASGY